MSTKKRVIAFEIISMGTPRLMTMRVVGQDASQVQSRHYMDTRCYSPAAWNTPSLCPWPTTPHQDPAQVRATEPKRVRPSRILNGEKSNNNIVCFPPPCGGTVFQGPVIVNNLSMELQCSRLYSSQQVLYPKKRVLIIILIIAVNLIVVIRIRFLSVQGLKM